jgi:hypothetical protein
VPGGPRDNSSTFTIDGVMPGQYFLRLRFGTAKAEAITWEGQDYSDRPFDMTTGRDVAGVVITLTSKSSAISGTVSDGGTALTSPAAVIAFPTEPEQWSNYGFNPTRLASVLTTQAGQYRIEGLPLGEYYLLAVPAAQERAWLDPAFLAGQAARASRIRIDSSDTTIAGSTLSLVK